jgi:hypothetical protein
MKQSILSANGSERVTTCVRKRVFRDEINPVVPWTQLAGLIQPIAPGYAG